MSSFEVKQISEADAFKLETALREEMDSHEQSDPKAADTKTTTTDRQNSQVAEVMREVVSHWIDADEAGVQRFARDTGDVNLEKKIAGLSEIDMQPQGITGDFKADSAGPEEGLDTPPKLDGGEFGGGGGGGGGGADGGANADWSEPAAAAASEADERGFDPSGGDDDGEGDVPDPADDPKNRPKK